MPGRRIIPVLAVGTVVLASVGVAGPAAARPAHHPRHQPALTKQPVASGHGGAVVSDTVDSTEAGLRVLRHGGTAADAAVAVAATLGVSDPFVAGIGGGGYFTYYNARTHRVSTIDGRETTPTGDSSTMFVDPETGKPYDFATAVTSGRSVGVPGTLATWQRALQRFGRFSLADDLRPAVDVAQHGFTVDATFREQVRENQSRFAQFPATAKLFLPGGRLPAVGSTLKNPDLASTYRQIARQGTSALYGGSIGRDVVATVQHPPVAEGVTAPLTGPMTIADLRGYRTVDRAPTHVSYRGYDVYGMGPSSSGGITVGEALNILQNFRLSPKDRTAALQHYLEASRLAFADRNRYVGDSAYVRVPQRALLSASFAKQRACLIAPTTAGLSPAAPGDPAQGAHGCTPQTANTLPGNDGISTNHFVVSDRWGNVVSYTNTIEELGGNGIVVPGRGFVLNNELTDFNFAPTQGDAPDPNLPAPGKRPRSSMAPTIVLAHGRPFLAVGSPGGASIITTVLQILMNRIDLRMSLEDAIAAPRASQRNGATTQVEPAFLDEASTPALESYGQKFAVTDTSPLDPSITIPPTIGKADGLEFGPDGRVTAAGEPVRRGGSSAGVVVPSRPHR